MALLSGIETIVYGHKPFVDVSIIPVVDNHRSVRIRHIDHIYASKPVTGVHIAVRVPDFVDITVISKNAGNVLGIAFVGNIENIDPSAHHVANIGEITFYMNFRPDMFLRMRVSGKLNPADFRQFCIGWGRQENCAGTQTGYDKHVAV